MDHAHNNPLLSKAIRSVDRGQTQPSTCGGKPTQTLPPSRIRKLVSELGFRYRPSAQADLEAHAAALGLLSSDLADVPPELLERAVNRWVTSKPFLPKASELIDLARQAQSASGPQPGSDGKAVWMQGYVDEQNRQEEMRNTSHRWRIAGTAPNRHLERYDFVDEGRDRQIAQEKAAKERALAA